MSEQKQRLIEGFLLNYYSVTELAERFSISPKASHAWSNQQRERSMAGLEPLRRPQKCPWQTDRDLVAEIVELVKEHRVWGPEKCFNTLARRDPY